MVLRRQFERLLQFGQLRNVEIQVLPMDCTDNTGLDGHFHLLRLGDGTHLGHVDMQQPQHARRSCSRRDRVRPGHCPHTRRKAPAGPRLDFGPQQWAVFLSYAAAH
ncbi:Scr1 family TA system antitoxin-like transcriptional regulator [Streptomyces sp. NPDC008092]|uniref:Scr1 family TA system antitoxin-like transcriptional regulator n=1 Tax=Streptomyces sp. NPDC008092 TaxID=3364808 RepID=UPI0036E76101